MPKCPNCGSSAQVRLSASTYEEDGWTIKATHYYTCGCGCTFTGTSYYHCQEAYEIIEEIPKK